MIVRSYTGRTVAEALEKVRNDLGSQALIIETRTCKEPGLFGRQCGYEVVAAGDPDAQATSSPSPARTSPRAAEKAYAAATPTDPPRRPGTLPIDFGNHQHSQASQLVASIPEATVGEFMQRGDLSLEIASIRRQLARLATGHGVPTDHLGAEVSQLFEERELPAEIIAECDEVIAKAGERIPEAKRAELLARYLARQLRCNPGIDWNATRCLIVAGPTGVGKTTTIAKLAGDLVLRRGRRIGLITVDTYRVGATDQLQAYADLLDMPFAVARTPAELGHAVDSMADCDNILVDTAGRSPADAARVHEIKGFCRAVPGMVVALAVAANAGRAEYASVIERFSLLPVEHCLLTKIDECSAPGRLYGCLRRHALTVSYCTTGQEVPDDIEAADALTLARLVTAPAAESSPSVAVH
ncbi:MAG: flagellar biosynthesis protein FlhF [Planctomycetota bacterium]|nr:MAG: flagellar biosynthesis protein FlhF [Planctomycetota bacterium]